MNKQEDAAGAETGAAAGNAAETSAAAGCGGTMNKQEVAAGAETGAAAGNTAETSAAAGNAATAAGNAAETSAAAGRGGNMNKREVAAGAETGAAAGNAAETESRHEKLRFFCFDVLPIVFFMPAIIVCAAVFGQKFIKVLPVVVSLFVVLLSAHANRYTFLIGAVNSVIYSVGYIMERLYASVASALLLSFPIQIVSFVLWKKRSYRKTSRNIRTIPPRNYLWLVPLFAALWGGFFWLFSAVGSSNTVLDNTIFILGIFSSFFLMLGYLENVFISLVSTALGFWLWTTLTIGNIANITYLLYYVYLLFRQVQMLFIWWKLRREQRAAGKVQPAGQNAAETKAERAA